MSIKQLTKEYISEIKKYSDILFYDEEMNYVNPLSLETYNVCHILFLDTCNNCIKTYLLWEVAKELHKIEML